jgi:cytoskeleton protein RodZ
MKRLPRQVEHDRADAARVGEELRDARQALGLTLDEVSQRLRIRRPYLEALEEGRIGDLPGMAYAVGFVRTYAGGLGLNADDLVRRFRDISGAGGARKPKLVFPEPVSERGMPAGIIVAAGAVFAIGAYVAWFNWAGNGSRVVDVVPPVPPRLEAAVEQGRSQLPAREALLRPEPGTVPLAALPPPGGFAPAGSAPPANAAAQAATLPPPPVVSEAPPPAPPFADIPGIPAGTRVVLRPRTTTREGAWVQVRDPRAGQVVLNRVLRPGEAWPVPVRDGLVMDTGKADSLEILVDGAASPALTGAVGVRRNIPLDPQRLMQPLPAPTAAATPAPAPARN